MIEADKRKAVYLLHKEGMSIREISHRFSISRKTVRLIIKHKGEIIDQIRKDKIIIDSELLINLYGECEGWVQRVHEKLIEEKKINISYSTLTRMLRELGISGETKQRCDRVPDVAGAEIQHDTSPYKLEIGSKKLNVVCSLVYFRYSKMRYVKFYRSFNRFKMKCFFHEALTFFKYCAPICIIDNTNLARLRGTGKNAVMVPEMERFAAQYRFKFICHRIKHSNRKAGNERSFYTVETNFFPGREFESMEDLNTQAFEWATERIANRPLTNARLIPAQAFEYEKVFLKKITSYIPPPYRVHKRGTDQYGYAAFGSNYYWIPGTRRDAVIILEYSNDIKIYRKRKFLAEYLLPPEGTKNHIFSPKGKPGSIYKPKYRKKPTEQEEKRLRSISDDVDTYLNFALKPKGQQRHRFIRELFGLSKKLTVSLFITTIKRALKYHITDMKTVERIAILQINDGLYKMPFAELDGEFRNRESYQNGRLTDEPDLSIYDRMLEDDENE